MSSSLWLSIEPCSSEIRLLLAVPHRGTALKARLPPRPAHPRALPMLMGALSSWYRLPLHAALDADASDVQRNPELWAQWTGDMPGLEVSVEWVARPGVVKTRDRFLDLGDFASGKRLITFGATGLK
jgi:hypothetical protein